MTNPLTFVVKSTFETSIRRYGMPCQQCSARDERIRQARQVEFATDPSILELATMVNLEYYLDMRHSCLHDIPESHGAKITVKDMVRYLDERMWTVVTRTKYEGEHIPFALMLSLLSGFTCTSFLNRVGRQLVIVHRGTALTNIKQLIADVRIAIKMVTSGTVSSAGWHTLQSILNNTMKLDGARFRSRSNQSVTITGHSLGGWLAQLSTLLRRHPAYFNVGACGMQYFGNGKSIDMDQPCMARCVAFDSPGAEAILTRLRDEPSWLGGRSSSSDVAVKLDELDVTVYLANKNLVNWCGQHTGRVKQIDVMKDASWCERWFMPAASHSMERILKYFQENPEE